MTSCLLSTEKELYEFILKKTLESVPVMVNTDFYNLPYHSEYRKTHFNHIVVIYDMNDNSVGYSDCCTSIIGMPCYQRYIDWQEFFSMLEEGRVYQVWYIEKNIKRHNTQILGINKPMDVDSDKQFVGVDAIMQLSKIYRSISNSCTLTEKVKDKLRYHYCFFTGFGGPVVTRTLFYSYLKILGEEVLANECLNIKQQWMISSKDIIRATILDNMERINFFSERLVYIADLERKFIDKTTKLKRDIRV